jgi:hypothetical protein
LDYALEGRGTQLLYPLLVEMAMEDLILRLHADFTREIEVLRHRLEEQS